jgi:DNA-binding GntR family transcriptional regulator
MDAASTTSTPQLLAQALRDDLLDGSLEPGSRITEEALAARFNFGRHSVRSGLQMLVSEGLLEHQRNRGIVVPEVTEERIDEMCTYRSILELGALRLALSQGADFSEVSAAVDHLESLSETASWRHVIEAHGAVHRQIAAASENPRLISAHRACENELNSMLAIVRADFSARRLAIMHRDLVNQLRVGGDVAMRALEDDLELGGRAAMHLALRRQRGQVVALP